jgi:hypothetical protein
MSNCSLCRLTAKRMVAVYEIYDNGFSRVPRIKEFVFRCNKHKNSKEKKIICPHCEKRIDD